MSKRRRGYNSETRVKHGQRIVHSDKELIEKLGRNDPCPCLSGRRFQSMLSDTETVLLTGSTTNVRRNPNSGIGCCQQGEELLSSGLGGCASCARSEMQLVGLL
jgi:SEC-C motif